LHPADGRRVDLVHELGRPDRRIGVLLSRRFGALAAARLATVMGRCSVAAAFKQIAESGAA
jgi:hypothetical protein